MYKIFCFFFHYNYIQLFFITISCGTVYMYMLELISYKKLFKKKESKKN